MQYQDKSNAHRDGVSDKAGRLCKSHRVILLGPGRALVIGDHDTYSLCNLGKRWLCNCLWGSRQGHWRDCSHVMAVRLALKDPASQVPVARLADLINLSLDSMYQKESA